MGGTQAIAVNSPISAEQGLQLPQAVANALVRGIGDGLLTPSGQGLQVGLDLKPLLRGNPLAVGVGTGLESVLAVAMAVVNPVFDASEQLVSPVAQVADLGLPKTPRATAAASAASASSARSVSASSARALPAVPETVANQDSAAPSVAAPVEISLPPAVRDIVSVDTSASSQVGAAVRDTVKSAASVSAASPGRKLGRGAVRDAIKSAVKSVVKAPR
jgi:hypothetical protein